MKLMAWFYGHAHLGGMLPEASCVFLKTKCRAGNNLALCLCGPFTRFLFYLIIPKTEMKWLFMAGETSGSVI